MSAYITLSLPITDQECLILALVDMGFHKSAIEIHEQPKPLVGFEGRQRQQLAHIIVRRINVGQSSNDLGFERTALGFRAHISDYDSACYNSSWLEKLNLRYQHHTTEKRLRLERESGEKEIERRRVAEIELRKQEDERRQLVEAQKKAIQDKARAMGYRVQEQREGDKIRLVLVKRVF